MSRAIRPNGRRLPARPDPRGVAHRARLARIYLPRLVIGSRIPSSSFLGELLGICPQEAYRHMRQVLRDAGVVTETRGVGVIRRIYVVAMPDQEMAA